MNSEGTPECIFCNISEGTTPADVVYETEKTVFFRDIAPKARVHIVGIPRQHFSSIDAMTEADHDLIGQLFHDATHVAGEVGVAGGGYRLISNVGSDAGQEIEHLHIHILGGEPLGPLRC